MSEWQPIETAPKDGSKFMAYSSRNGRYDYLKWDEGDQYYLHHFISLLGYGGVPIAHLTHWMPLPSPPKPSKE